MMALFCKHFENRVKRLQWTFFERNAKLLTAQNVTANGTVEFTCTRTRAVISKERQMLRVFADILQ